MRGPPLGCNNLDDILQHSHNTLIPGTCVFSNHRDKVNSLCAARLGSLKVRLFVPSVSRYGSQRFLARLNEDLLPLGRRDGEI